MIQGGDTNGDGKSTVAENGDWGSINVLASRGANNATILNYTDIRYGGYNQTGYMLGGNGTLVVNNSIIKGSSEDGIKVTGELSLNSSKIIDNDKIGVHAKSDNNFDVKLNNNKFENNKEFAGFITFGSSSDKFSGANNTGAELVICDFYRVIGDKLSTKGKIKSKKVFSLKEYGDYMMKNPADYYYGVLWNKLYRKAIIDKYKIKMIQEVSWCEDFLFNLEYVKNCNIFYAIQVPVYYYVKTENSLSNGNLNPQRIAHMKYQTFIEYNNFFQQIFTDEEYQATKRKIYRYLVDSASDGGNSLLHSQQLGQEITALSTYVLESDSDFIKYYRYIKLYSSFFTPLTHKYNLSNTELLILDLLDNDIGINRDDLHNILGLSRQQLAIELQLLQIKGYIVYNGYEQDKTTYDITFTAQSAELIKSIRKIKRNYQEIITSDLSKEELQQYQQIKNKIDNSIKQRLANIAMLSNK